MGEDVNVHDQWAVESQGKIHDRTREHLGYTDRAIIAYRKLLLAAIDQAEKGERPMMVLDRDAAQRLKGPMTVDGIGPTADWESYWRETYAKVAAASTWAKGSTRAA
jgi:phthalate 4,5-dioxygenase